MSNQVIHIEDGEAEAFVAEGRKASPSAQHPPHGSRQIIQFQAGNRRRLDGLESAIETDEESFQSIGSIAVRLVANWSLPRCQMLLRRMET